MKLVYQGELFVAGTLFIGSKYIGRSLAVKPSLSVLANGKEVPLRQSFTILNLLENPPWVVAEGARSPDSDF